MLERKQMRNSQYNHSLSRRIGGKILYGRHKLAEAYCRFWTHAGRYTRRAGLNMRQKRELLIPSLGFAFAFALDCPYGTIADVPAYGSMRGGPADSWRIMTSIRR